MKEIKIEIFTPAKAAYDGNAKSISIPGTVGNFQVLYNHAPLLSSFDTGIIKIVEDENVVKEYSTGGGTVEILDNKVLVLAESFESPQEIDKNRAEAALDRAKERLSIEGQKKESVDLIRAEVALKRAINRLKLKKKYS
ncbi:MAG: ATP synthase F1 subunit epsilon [Ignavibacteria bacterium]|jgi:F-type H+-transporting ATPase subunit epsilon